MTKCPPADSILIELGPVDALPSDWPTLQLSSVPTEVKQMDKWEGKEKETKEGSSSSTK